MIKHTGIDSEKRKALVSYCISKKGAVEVVRKFWCAMRNPESIVSFCLGKEDFIAFIRKTLSKNRGCVTLVCRSIGQEIRVDGTVLI